MFLSTVFSVALLFHHKLAPYETPAVGASASHEISLMRKRYSALLRDIHTTGTHAIRFQALSDTSRQNAEELHLFALLVC